MLRNIIISLILSLCFTLGFAVYYPSDDFITDNIDAQTKCLVTCNNLKSQWTGHWWSPSDDISVCECFHSWPYCPITDEPPPMRPCVLPIGTAAFPLPAATPLPSRDEDYDYNKNYYYNK